MPADAPVIITFDHPLRRSSLPGRFHVTPPLPGCDVAAAFSAAPGRPCRVDWLNEGRTFELDHRRAPFAPDTRYTLTVDSGVADDRGAVNTLDHQWQITTEAAPTVVSVDPADGSTAVPIDVSPTITFSRAMDPGTVARAIRLDPAAGASAVVPVAGDSTRFRLLTGGLLRPGARYAVAVTTAAQDTHGQPLVRTQVTRFTAGALSPGIHAVVLAGPPGGPPDTVLLSPVPPPGGGTAQTWASIYPCTSAPCPPPAGSSHLPAISDAAVSPGGTWLAVVATGDARTGAGTSLHVIEVATGRSVATVVGARLPAWSPSGRLLAFQDQDGVSLLQPDDGRISTLPPGPPLVDRPVWAGDSSLLLPTAGAPGTLTLQVANPALATRSLLPGVPGTAEHPVVSPSGRRLAMVVPGPGPTASLAVTDLGAASPRLRPLGQGRIPVGFLDDDDLVMVTTGATPSLERLVLSSGAVTPIALRPPPLDGSIVVPGASRLIGYLAPDASSGRVGAYVARPMDRASQAIILPPGATAAVSHLSFALPAPS